jgi:hypothetical protein
MTTLQCDQWGVYSVIGTPVTVTSSASSQTVAVPNDSTGNPARYCRIVSNGSAYVMPVQTGGTIAAGSGIMVNGTGDFVLYTRGFAKIAYIQEAAGSKVNITPLEV